jgi:hypothetical protein
MPMMAKPKRTQQNQNPNLKVPLRNFEGPPKNLQKTSEHGFDHLCQRGPCQNRPPKNLRVPKTSTSRNPEGPKIEQTTQRKMSIPDCVNVELSLQKLRRLLSLSSVSRRIYVFCLIQHGFMESRFEEDLKVG